MKTIVAPTDFSPTSLNAVNYAADLACAMNASLALIHICELPMTFSEVSTPAYNSEEMLQKAGENILQLKTELLNRTEGKIKIYTEVKTGPVTFETEKFCASLKPYSVVMGTRGAGAVERFFFGSNTSLAMKTFTWPVIVIPPGARFTSIKRVGLACDLKKVADTAPVEEIRTLVEEFNAELHVLHVNREDEPVYKSETIEESDLLQKMLEELRPVYHFMNYAGIEEGLNEFAEKNKLDILIVVPKKHNLVDKLLHRSLTKHLILHTHVPVMAVHE